jgi:hypothetical protein
MRKNTLTKTVTAIAAAFVALAASTHAFELNKLSAKTLARIEIQYPKADALRPQMQPDAVMRGFTWPGTVAEKPQPDFLSLNTAADLIMRTTVLMAVGGVKPFSDIAPVENPTLAGATQQINLLDEMDTLIRSGELKNTDLLFFKGRYHPDDPATTMMVIASRKGIARLLKDKTAIETLNKYKASIPYNIPQNIEGWIDFYKKAAAAGGYWYLGPVWANIVIGISLGYPPIEAEMYAINLQSHNLQNKRIGAERGGFILAGYARLTDLELERDEYYVGSQNVLMDNYEHLIASGLGPLEIMNHPDWLTQGMPSFPVEFLLPEVSEFPVTRRHNTYSSPL